MIKKRGPETDEASMLEEMIGKEVEVFTLNKWEKGIFVEDGLIQMSGYFYKLDIGDCLRFRKKLSLAYKEWLDVKSEKVDDTGYIKLNRFITILTALKSIYPVARLEDCKSSEERTLFMLNQNALGTLKT